MILKYQMKYLNSNNSLMICNFQKPEKLVPSPILCPEVSEEAMASEASHAMVQI